MQIKGLISAKPRTQIDGKSSQGEKLKGIRRRGEEDSDAEKNCSTQIAPVDGDSQWYKAPSKGRLHLILVGASWEHHRVTASARVRCAGQ
jgi:hypothetical protein